MGDGRHTCGSRGKGGSHCTCGVSLLQMAEAEELAEEDHGEDADKDADEADLSTSRCRPCNGRTDGGCSHQGNANQAWCNAHCPRDGRHTCGSRGKGGSHCTCGVSLLQMAEAEELAEEDHGENADEDADEDDLSASRCRPCNGRTDGGCSHQGNANQAWCNAHCPRDGRHTCGSRGKGGSHCTCGVSLLQMAEA